MDNRFYIHYQNQIDTSFLSYWYKLIQLLCQTDTSPCFSSLQTEAVFTGFSSLQIRLQIAALVHLQILNQWTELQHWCKKFSPLYKSRLHFFHPFCSVFMHCKSGNVQTTPLNTRFQFHHAKLHERWNKHPIAPALTLWQANRNQKNGTSFWSVEMKQASYLQFFSG